MEKQRYKTKYHIISGLFVMLTVLAFLGSCSFSKKEKKYNGYYIYCLDTNETKVEGEQVKINEKDPNKLIPIFLKKMQHEPNTVSLKKAIPDNVKVDEFTLGEQGDLCIYWNSAYSNYSGISEILRRAAIVKTLCQIPDVTNVEFYVAGQPLTDSNMNAVGYMSAETFIDNTGQEDYYQKTTLNVYFSDVTGRKLKKVPVDVTYEATISLAQLAVEQLIAGPSSINEDNTDKLLDTIPDGTKINRITVKDNICFLDLSGDFLEKRSDISDDVALYSVVNTLVDLPNINQVQFNIDGEQVLLYDDYINFGEPFSANLDIVE